ncbi:MAG: polysaccharide pyruvyl transferase family protein, partial [Acidobacteriota bacterium]|nr:polysaccharide pyruvyl transferase family protein [Acidobacteriota bacterium]
MNFGAPFCTMGTGVGSAGFGAPQDAPLDGWRQVLQDSKFLGVRGPLSKEQLEAASIRGSTVIGDPALSLTSETVPPFRSRERLVINLARESGQRLAPAEQALWAEAGAIAKEFAGRGGEVVGVALGSGDFRALTEFRSATGLRGMRIQSHRTDPEGLLRTLAGSIGLIGVRLHSAVLA